MNLQFIEAFCSIAGMIGTVLIAKRNKLGYCFYFPSNILWIYYAIATRQFFFMSQYVFFTIMSIVGFTNWRRLEKKESLEVKS